MEQQVRNPIVAPRDALVQRGGAVRPLADVVDVGPVSRELRGTRAKVVASNPR